jgi:hypothetical protein
MLGEGGLSANGSQIGPGALSNPSKQTQNGNAPDN